MPRVVHFEICAEDPEKVSAFYEKVFGWEIARWGGPQVYWLINSGDPETPGINGGILNPRGLFSGTVNTIEVPDVDAYTQKVTENGGQILVEKRVVPGVGYQVYCKDVEGTVFGLHQSDPTAGQ